MKRPPIVRDQLDLANWPTVAHTALSEPQRLVYLARETAISMYASEMPVPDIEAATGIVRSQLYRLLRRCLTEHDDGRIQGFRGLLHYRRLRPYVRQRPLKLTERGGRSASGAFQQLLDGYPGLRQWLQEQISPRRVLVEQLGSDSTLRIRLRGLEALHAQFLKQCRSLGLTNQHYPFTTRGKAIRTFSRTLKAELLRAFGPAARAAGARHLKGLPPSLDRIAAPPATRPYEVVEFDGHRLDVRLKVLLSDPLGFVHEFEIERVWLLVILDVLTRVVLGYNLVLAREYSRYDVIKTIEHALEPHRPRSFTIEGLGYSPVGGFASSRMPELAYACWEHMRVDNAKANLAADTRAVLRGFVGCFVDAGAAYSPDERPYIERFFYTIAKRLSHRLPGCTGAHPNDVRRGLSDPKGKLRLIVSLDELEQLMEASIAYYNGLGHDGLNGRSPLEAMEYFVRSKQYLPRWLAEPRRRTLCLMQSARRSTVRGDLPRGIRPHISVYGVRYSNDILANSAQLLNQKILVYVNAEDLRTLRAFYADGAELGVLKASGRWGERAHNLKLRQEILRLRREGRLRYAQTDNPVDAYLAFKRGQAKNSRKAASELAAAQRLLAEGGLPRTPPGPDPLPERSRIDEAAPLNSSTTPLFDAAQPAANSTPKRPQPLPIGTGYVV